MSESERAAIAQRLQDLADQIASWMQSPTFWEYGGPISLDTVFPTFPDLLGDRLRSACIEEIRQIQSLCAIAGLPAVSEMLQRQFDAAVGYLNSASDFLNMSWPFGVPARDIVPHDVCLDYSMSGETPVWELRCQLQSLATELGKETIPEDISDMPAESGRAKAAKSPNGKNAVREFASATDPIPKEYRHGGEPNGEPYGPLVGSGAQLASAIWARTGRRKGDLLKLHNKGRVFVREMLDRKFEAYFRTPGEFSKAKLRLENQQPSTSARTIISGGNT